MKQRVGSNYSVTVYSYLVLYFIWFNPISCKYFLTKLALAKQNQENQTWKKLVEADVFRFGNRNSHHLLVSWRTLTIVVIRRRISWESFAGACVLFNAWCVSNLRMPFHGSLWSIACSMRHGMVLHLPVLRWGTRREQSRALR